MRRGRCVLRLVLLRVRQLRRLLGRLLRILLRRERLLLRRLLLRVRGLVPVRGLLRIGGLVPVRGWLRVRGLLSVRGLLGRVLRLMARRELLRVGAGLVWRLLVRRLLVMRRGRRRGLVRRLVRGRGLVGRLLRWDRRSGLNRLIRRDRLHRRVGRVLRRAGLAVGMGRVAVPVGGLRPVRVNGMGHMSSP
ncbi:hypothetical protein [Streptomyces sp. NPDC048481]|uniref:hypothetical protein n=1 Tax=Streptomyces sp. NPDC048481 TaxID=3365557 RepID=UPI0037141D44